MTAKTAKPRAAATKPPRPRRRVTAYTHPDSTLRHHPQASHEIRGDGQPFTLSDVLAALDGHQEVEIVRSGVGRLHAAVVFAGALRRALAEGVTEVPWQRGACTDGRPAFGFTGGPFNVTTWVLLGPRRGASKGRNG